MITSDEFSKTKLFGFLSKNRRKPRFAPTWHRSRRILVNELSAEADRLSLGMAHDAHVAGPAGALWQGAADAGAARAVLGCVFAAPALGARELWAAARVCRAWRRAAAAPALWRRRLLPRAAPPALRALDALLDRTDADGRSDWSWQKEYALVNARWDICEQLLAPGASSAALLCATLHSSGTYLAVVDDDARLTIYEHIRLKANKQENESEWKVQWSDVVKTEWRSISFAQWAPHATSLLLGGRLALVDRFELLCINFDDDWQSKVVCRSGSGPGGAGCWVDDCNFLSMRLQLLAPGHACTTVWLNAASQETYSEFAGVTAPLLRIYNESSTHISHILVADVPKHEISNGNTAGMSIDDVTCIPNASYYNSLQGYPQRKGETQRVLVAAGGVAEGERGQARALLAWPLPELQVPVLWVEDHLAQRVQRHRLRLEPGPDDEPEPEPDVKLMRALCTPPESSCNLSDQILGIVLHPRGGCVWATTTSGAACVSLPQLTPLLRLAGDRCEPLLSPHYVLPAVDDDYFVTPAGGGAGTARLWAARSGRGGARLRHGAPALAAFLLPRRARRRRLLVLTSDNIYNKLSINVIQHNTPNVTRSGKDKLSLFSFKEFPAIAIILHRYASFQSNCYELLQANMYSTRICGEAPTATSKENINVDKLSSMLHERSQLKEAALGRVATTPIKQSNKKELGGGALDLQVPPSAETVRVRVLLDFKSPSLHEMKTRSDLKAMNVPDEMWLSMKNFQKKCDKDNVGLKPDLQQKVDKIKANPCASKPRQEPPARHPPTVCPPCRPKTKFNLIPGFPVIY